MASQKSEVIPLSWDGNTTPTGESDRDIVATIQIITDAFSTALNVDSPLLTRNEQSDPESPPSDHSNVTSPCRH